MQTPATMNQRAGLFPPGAPSGVVVGMTSTTGRAGSVLPSQEGRSLSIASGSKLKNIPQRTQRRDAAAIASIVLSMQPIYELHHIQVIAIRRRRDQPICTQRLPFGGRLPPFRLGVVSTL